jgi:hypothetical protein
MDLKHDYANLIEKASGKPGKIRTKHRLAQLTKYNKTLGQVVGEYTSKQGKQYYKILVDNKIKAIATTAVTGKEKLEHGDVVVIGAPDKRSVLGRAWGFIGGKRGQPKVTAEFVPEPTSTVIGGPNAQAEFYRAWPKDPPPPQKFFIGSQRVPELLKRAVANAENILRFANPTNKRRHTIDLGAATRKRGFAKIISEPAKETTPERKIVREPSVDKVHLEQNESPTSAVRRLNASASAPVALDAEMPSLTEAAQNVAKALSNVVKVQRTSGEPQTRDSHELADAAKPIALHVRNLIKPRESGPVAKDQVQQPKPRAAKNRSDRSYGL